jgi:hypothetical protein
VGEHPICNFNAGFCDWTQDGDDNFDWALTSEGTPTSYTGPSTGAGHGGGAFIHIEANGQTEGAYAAITSSTTGCGLYVDYHMYGGGIGTLTVSAKDAAGGEDAAWVPVWTKEGGQGDSWQAATIYSASDSYYQVMATRGGGIRGDIAVDNLNVIWCSPAPTAAPTNEGDTHVPTVSPTAVPTHAPTTMPTITVEIWIGTHDGGTGPKTATSEYCQLSCPITANSNNWLTVDTHPDTFAVSTEELSDDSNIWTIISAVRVDCSSCGWSMNLGFMCTGVVCPEPTLSPTAAPTALPTLAPTNIGQLPICNFNAGFCDWTQDNDDNFDWDLTSEGTPTSNTGPTTGAGPGGGAFIHIEANGRTEGAYAAITSSNTGCGLYIDYHMYGGGIGSLTVSVKNAADSDDAAWVPVWTKEGAQGDNWQAATIYSALGSYYRVTATRGPGNRGDIAVDNLNVIWCSPAPTATPTNEGDTHSPTASPTAVPTASPTSVPTSAPTSAPTAVPTTDFNNIPNWADLNAACSDSACVTTNGGCIITLSDDFVMGSYSGRINFSGKTITVWAQGKTLDASGGGRFFKASGGGSSLELHAAVLQNGYIAVRGSAFGGAIYATDGANVKIHDSTIKSNTASSMNGGGCIGGYSQSGGACSFSTCCGTSCSDGPDCACQAFATSSNSGWYCYFAYTTHDYITKGGAIFADNGANVEVHDSTFQSNVASYGGSIYAGSDTNVKLYDSTFLYNSVGNQEYLTRWNAGGAIYAGNAANIEIHSTGFRMSETDLTSQTQAELASNFFGQSGSLGGGAIYAGDAPIHGSTNTGVYTGVSGVYEPASGNDATVKIYDSTFEGNTGTVQSNAELRAQVAITFFGSNLEVQGSTFQSNNGGAIRSHNVGANVKIYECVCYGSSTAAQAITFSMGDVEIYNSTFESNGQGAIHVTNLVNLVIYDSTFASNTRPSYLSAGGAIDASYSVNLQIYGSTFDNNNGGGGGGAIYAVHGYSHLGQSNYDLGQRTTVEIYDSTFQSNSQSNSCSADSCSGGAIYAEGVNVTIYRSIFQSNSAISYGGAISVGSNAIVTVYESTFESNEAGVAGGAIQANVDAELFVLIQVTMDSNEPASLGGQILSSAISCYSGFFVKAASSGCEQCDVATYKYGTNAINSCKECPEVLYLYTILTM